jgi:AraC-like DNA-binding protein
MKKLVDPNTPLLARIDPIAVATATARAPAAAAPAGPRATALAGGPRAIAPSGPAATGVVWATECIYAAGDAVCAQDREYAYLVIPQSGRLCVTTPERAWSITPREAVWIPASTPHEVRAPADARAAWVAIARQRAGGVPDIGIAMNVSGLVREIIARLLLMQADERDGAGRDEHLAAVLLDELSRPTPPAGIALPADERLRVLCAAVLDEPDSPASPAQWAARFGMTRKSLARAFRRELRTTFGAWRRATRVEHASRLLAAGERVTDVALDMGYESLSAFTAMFRKTAGYPPSKVRKVERGKEAHRRLAQE